MKYFVKSGTLNSEIIADSHHDAVINSIINQDSYCPGLVISCRQDGDDEGKTRLFLTTAILKEVNIILERKERKEKLIKLKN